MNNAGDSFALLHSDGSGVKMTSNFLLPDDIRLNFGDFNNTKLYFNEQDANFIPVPTANLLTPFLYEADNLFPERVTPSMYLNKTNTQLKNEFGSSFGGKILPSNAISNPMITGGKILDNTLSNPDILTKENEVVLYPNPARNLITVKTSIVNLGIKVYSLQGTLINSTNSKSMDISTLYSCIYLDQIIYC